MTTQKKRDGEWGVAVEKDQCTPFIVGVHEEGSSPNQPPTVYSTAEHLLQNHKHSQLTGFQNWNKLQNHQEAHQGWAQRVIKKARERRVKAEFGQAMQVLLKANEPFKGSGENKSMEWAVMVSQGDITLLQKIAQPKAQSQLVWSSAGSAWGERRGAEAPIHCRETGPLFKGKQGFLSPPRPGRKVRAQNTNSSGNSTISVANNRSASSSTKPVASNYMVNMKCLSL